MGSRPPEDGHSTSSATPGSPTYDGYARVIAEVAAGDGLEFVVSAKDVARSAASLGRGLALERLLDPAAVSEERFEELFSNYVVSFTRPRAGSR